MKRVKLNEVVKELESGARPKGGVSSESGTIPSLGAEHLSEDGGFNFHKNKFVTAEFFNNLKSGKVKDNDILIVKDGATTGKVSFVENDFPFTNAAINEHVFRIAINKQIGFSKYVYYYLRSSEGKKQILNDFRGATVGGISRQFIESTKIPLPSIDDQIRIATVLTQAEKLIAKRKESIKALDELLKSTFLEMFGDPVRMIQQPKIKLSKFIIFLTSGSRGWAQHYSETGDVFIRINNVRDACLKLDDIIYVTPPNNAEAVRTKVRTNDLLFSITADLGRTAVVNEVLNGAFINQHLALIRLKQEKINPVFVSWYFAMPYGKSMVMKKNREGVKAGLNFDDIRGFEIVLPPLPLQNQFAAIVEKVESLKSKYTQILAELENLYGSLSQRAFKGELNLSRVSVDVEVKHGAAEAKMEFQARAEGKIISEFTDNDLEELIRKYSGKIFSFEELWKEIETLKDKKIPSRNDIQDKIIKLLESENVIFQQVFDILTSQHDKNDAEKQVAFRGNYEN